MRNTEKELTGDEKRRRELSPAGAVGGHKMRR
jgi:hypothetical protein